MKEIFSTQKHKLQRASGERSALRTHMEYCLHTQMQILQIADGKNW